MSSFIIEEVETNDVPEDELAEFVTAEDIPIVNEDDVDLPSDSDDSDGSDIEQEFARLKAGTNRSHASTSSAKPKKKPTVASEKLQAILLKKFMNNEISYNDYMRKMGSVEETADDVDSPSASSDDSNDTPMQRVKKQGKKHAAKAETHHAKKTKRALPPALQGLMGQANLCFARGDSTMAEKLCLEIIRQEPTAAEPYLTMAQIYENTDSEKYEELLLIAAHVNSTVFQWTQCAEIFLERGNLKQASVCYAKATRCDPKDLSIRMKRLDILKQLGDEKHVLHCTYCMLGFIPKDQHELLITQAKWVAQQYHSEGLVTKSLDAMLKAYSKVPEHFTTHDVHSLIELLIKNKQYRKCLNVLIYHTGLGLKIKQKSKDSFTFSDIEIPDDMLIDLRNKMCICLVYLKAYNLFETLIDNVLQFIDVEAGGDCYLDIAEALMLQEKFADALRLLDPLVESKSYSLAAVWLKHAMCLRAEKRFQEAINSYKIVVDMSHDWEARLTLAALLKQEGRLEEALVALSQDPAKEIMETELLKEKCLLLKQMGRIDDYLDDGYKMMLRHCVHLRSRSEVQICSNFTRINDRLNELKTLRKNRNQEIDDIDAPQFKKSDNEPTLSDDWNLFIDLVNTAWTNKRYVKLQRLSFAAMSSRRFQSHIREIDFIGTVACLFNKEEIYGYNKIREFLNLDKDKPRFWNLFNLIVYVTQDCRFHRFVTRLFERTTPINIPPLVYMIIANYCLLSNSYKHALNHYDEIYRRFQPPLVAMLLGILYAQIANQRFTNRKQNLLVQAMNYMEKYQQTREPEAEAEILYNIGRMYHQIGIISVAKKYYERALAVSNPFIEEHREMLDLKREIAYNLHVIYRQSGNRAMARKMLYDHIVI
jgi:general transcription factor 3C polypeptide 3 (transcription factor C subunit 4)